MRRREKLYWLYYFLVPLPLSVAAGWAENPLERAVLLLAAVVATLAGSLILFWE